MLQVESPQQSSLRRRILREQSREVRSVAIRNRFATQCSLRCNVGHHPARASKATMLKTADRVLGVHGFVTPILPKILSCQKFQCSHDFGIG